MAGPFPISEATRRAIELTERYSGQQPLNAAQMRFLIDAVFDSLAADWGPLLLAMPADVTKHFRARARRLAELHAKEGTKNGG